MAGVAILFMAGLDRRLAKKMYPLATTLPQRLAAPLIFGTLSAACFLGLGHWVLMGIVATGLPLVAMNRWKLRRKRAATTAA